MIGAKKGALGAALDAGLQQPTSNGLCHVAQLRESVTLDSRSAGSDGRRLMLQFNRNQVWITLYRFLKAVVEHRVNNPIFAGIKAVAYLTASVNAIARSGGERIRQADLECAVSVKHKGEANGHASISENAPVRR
jgi:hypothetical protein